MRMCAAFILILSVFLGRADAGMEQQVYVWQRHWTPSVEAAIGQVNVGVDGITLLCAEVMRDAQGVPASVRVLPNWDLLKSSGLPITLAIRVGSYAGDFGIDAPMTQGLLAEVTQALTSAREAGLQPAAVEIDFDCATRLLESYTEWLYLLRERLDGVSLSITTLPTWMSRPEAFRQLVAATDHFVLQVHSIQRAGTIDTDVMLCDPNQAHRWTQQAAAFGKPYHVALPTYAYRLAYDTTGKLIEVAAENATPIQNPSWRYRVIRSDAGAMSSLVRRFESTRPEDCQGVIWYRLPVGAERYNWDTQTWHAVMAGQSIEDTWSVAAKSSGTGIWEIELVQHSEIALEPPAQIVASWEQGTAIAWDGQRNYGVKRSSDQRLVWTWPEHMSPPLLSQGTRWTIGWLRIEAPVELNFTIIDHAE